MNPRNIFSNSIWLRQCAWTLIALVACSCVTEYGCNDPYAVNYDSSKEPDPNSCKYKYGGHDYGVVNIGSSDTGEVFNVFVDSVYIGRVDKYYSNSSDYCNRKDVAKIELPAGEYDFVLEGSRSDTYRYHRGSLGIQQCLSLDVSDFVKVDSFPTPPVVSPEGTVIFWTSEVNYGVSVSIGDRWRTVQQRFTSAPNDCRGGFDAKFDGLIPGEFYNYQALLIENRGDTRIDFDPVIHRIASTVRAEDHCVYVQLSK